MGCLPGSPPIQHIRAGEREGWAEGTYGRLSRPRKRWYLEVHDASLMPSTGLTTLEEDRGARMHKGYGTECRCRYRAAAPKSCSEVLQCLYGTNTDKSNTTTTFKIY